jgi:plasmid stabilization system protein ParE
MATIVYAPAVVARIEQTGRPAPGVAQSIRLAVEGLAANPLTGRCIDGDLRELMISHGTAGYLALYRFVVARDEIRILGLRSRRELGALL